RFSIERNATMKIALISPYDLAVAGGVNTHVAYLAEHFRALDHTVRIIGPASDTPVMGTEPEVIAIGRPRPFPASGSIVRIAVNPRIGGEVRAVLDQQQFDVVHVHEPLMPLLPIEFLRFSDAVNVGTFHAAKDGGNRLYQYSARLLKRWFRRLDGKIAVSPAAERLVGRYFAGYYNIIPNGVTISRFTNQQPLPQFMDGKRNVLFVGRMEKRKGLKYLLRAFIAVKSEMPDARLIVVGEGKLRTGYERSMQLAGIPDVVFAGYVPDSQLGRYYASAHVFCAPNTANESQGYVLLEAMAAGRPVVASNIEGFAGVVTHGVEGFLCLPKDADALALGLVHMLADHESRAAMGRRAHARAEEFGWDRIAQRVLSYYERLLYERQLAKVSGPPNPPTPFPRKEGGVLSSEG
ncbi:MAG: glycosyltransferase family 4 protein, partial [Dehalococcoidia bacterium]